MLPYMENSENNAIHDCACTFILGLVAICHTLKDDVLGLNIFCIIENILFCNDKYPHNTKKQNKNIWIIQVPFIIKHKACSILLIDQYFTQAADPHLDKQKDVTFQLH